MTLAAVQETGHFSLAAQKSHISQPALSRRIKALEDWAGFALVDRRSRPVRLTPAGEQILDVALSSFKRLADERNILQQSNLMADRYVVRFAAQHSVAWRFFPDWLQGFENSFGPIMSRLRVDDLPDCISSFLAGDVDFLIAYNNPLLMDARGRCHQRGHRNRNRQAGTSLQTLMKMAAPYIHWMMTPAPRFPISAFHLDHHLASCFRAIWLAALTATG
jgi:DNA-binding transcriptional LysR family regulator